MRIWLGKEMEGRYKGFLTMFVESTVIDNSVLEKVFEYSKNLNPSIIYFGAGRKDVQRINVDCFSALKELNDKYILSIEFSKENTSVPLSYPFDINIFRTMTERGIFDLNNLQVKLDDNNKVYSQSADCMYYTCLERLKDDMYQDNDTQVYKEED